LINILRKLKYRYTKVEVRKNEIINRINKTKVEKESDFIKKSWEDHQKKMRKKQKEKKKKEAEEQKKAIEKAKQEAELREYKSLQVDDDAELNTDINMTAEEYEDDFM